MMSGPAQLDLTFTPTNRFDLIDVRRLIRSHYGDLLNRFPRTVYLSYHTTGGFFEQSLCDRLNHNPELLKAFVEKYRRLFPPGADYSHDRLHLRAELDESQKPYEPLNADSHLTFIGSGLANCVTYENSADRPVYFVDLDGEYRGRRRERRATVVGFRRASMIGQRVFQIPVSGHAIDSVNLKDPRLGLFQRIEEWLNKAGIERGRIDIVLGEKERSAGLTVNEYETLLMKHDLLEVLHNPLRFMAERGKHMLMDPRAIPGKAKDYAKYDLVQVINRFLDSLGLDGSLLERMVHPFLAVPAARFLRMKRSVSFLVSPGENSAARLIQGTYQSPVLVQWETTRATTRQVHVRLFRFEG